MNYGLNTSSATESYRDIFLRTGDRPLSRTRESKEWQVRNADLRPILVPLDGTAAAEHALPYAISLARRCATVLQLVQVYSYLDDFRGHGLSWGEENPSRAVREPREKYLTTVVRRISRRWDIPVVASLIEEDDPEAVLRQLHAGAAVTVMTSQRRTWVGRLCRRSMVDSLLGSFDHPLLLVAGYDAPVDLTGDPLCRHVLAVVETVDDLPSSVEELWIGPCPPAGRITILPLTDAVAGPAREWATTRTRERNGDTAPDRLEIQVEKVPVKDLNQVLNLVERDDIDLIAVPHLGHLRARPWEDHARLRSIAAFAPVPVLLRSGTPAAAATRALDGITASHALKADLPAP